MAAKICNVFLWKKALYILQTELMEELRSLPMRWIREPIF